MPFAPPPSAGRRNELVDYRALATYYEQEAAARARVPQAGRREELRGEFVARLRSESSHSVLDVGAGPARDGDAFVDAGLDYVGVDLAFGNAVLAAERSLSMIQASLFNLPVRERSFDAGWSMSTLLHVPDARLGEAMTSITSCLRPGGLFAVGLWGGPDREEVIADDHFDPPRFFSLRSHDRIRRMLGEHGHLVSFETWLAGSGPWEYQFAVLRVTDPTR